MELEHCDSYNFSNVSTTHRPRLVFDIQCRALRIAYFIYIKISNSQCTALYAKRLLQSEHLPWLFLIQFSIPEIPICISD